MNEMTSAKGERIVAVFEAAKGLLVLVAGFGLLTIIHKQAQQVTEEIVEQFHLNPAHHFPHIFIDLLDNITNRQLWLLALFAFAYAAIRLSEAYGLWLGRRWAEWLAVATGSIYVPIEVYELIARATWVKLFILLVNLGIVVFMGCKLREKQVSVAI